MIRLILYLVCAALPLALSCYIYKNSSPRFVRVWRRLVRSENARKLVGKVLTLYIAMLHIVLYAVSPKDMGLIASTMIMLALFSTNRSLRLLEWIRSDKRCFAAIGFIAIACSFYGPLMSTGLTIAAILVASLFMPNPALKEEQTDAQELAVDDKTFTAQFFA